MTDFDIYDKKRRLIKTALWGLWLHIYSGIGGYRRLGEDYQSNQETKTNEWDLISYIYKMDRE